MTTAAEAMLELRCEELERAGRMVERQLRKYLAGALCAVCGEPLGEDRQIIMDDNERTLHEECLDKEGTGPFSPKRGQVNEMRFVQKEVDRIGETIRQSNPVPRYDELYAAQQALMWALDPSIYKAPYDLLVVTGTPAGSEDPKRVYGK
jgi:hypothetical protein